MNLRKLRRKKINSASAKTSPEAVNKARGHLQEAGLYFQKGFYVEAARECHAALQFDSACEKAHYLLGLVSYINKEFEKAELYFKKAIKANPHAYGYHNNLGLVYYNLEKFDLAVDHYRETVRLKPGFVDGYSNMGNALKCLNNIREAQVAYQKALELAPENPDVLNNMGNAWMLLGEYGKAIDCFSKAILVPEVNPIAFLNLGYARQGINDNGKACEAFAKYLELSPHEIQAYIALVSAYERSGQLDNASQVIDRAMKLDLQNNDCKLWQSQIFLRQGKIAQAEELLGKIDISFLSNDSKIQFYYIGGQLQHKLANFDQAYDLFSQGNLLTRENKILMIKDLRDKNRWFTADPQPLFSRFTKDKVSLWSKNEVNAHGKSAPVFLVGFSRTGTTLLDQVLDSHPSVSTIEEKETLNPITDEFCCESGQLAFENLTPTQICDYRQRYWQQVEYLLDASEQEWQEKILVDRNPFYVTRLGFIYRFFPEAKIIFMVRDPRDVVLSNFMQNFSITASTLHFLRLEDAANYYAKVMDLFFLLRQVLPLNIHYVHYENLIENFEDEARGVLEFLGLEWTSETLNFHQTARKKHVRTVSYHQVVKPLYQTASGRWQKYINHLEPVLPILQPYVDIFSRERQDNNEKTA